MLDKDGGVGARQEDRAGTAERVQLWPNLTTWVAVFPFLQGEISLLRKSSSTRECALIRFHGPTVTVLRA